MKRIHLLLFACSSLVIAMCMYYFLTNKELPKTLKSSSRKSIALLLPLSHPSLESIKRGFMSTLDQSKYEFKEYNANGNATLMLAQAEEAVAGNFTMIVPIATSPALMIKELTIRKKKETPVVFIAADVGSLDSSISHITGVIDELPLEEEIEALLKVKPSTKKIALVYNGSDMRFKKTLHELQKVLTSHSIELFPIAIYHTSELNNKVPSLLDNSTDVLLILKDNVVVSGIDALIKLCAKKHITLMASDLDSVEKGAVLGFGVNEYDMGVSAAKMAKDILEKNKKPSEIAIQTIKNCVLKINTAMINAQPLEVELESLRDDKNVLFYSSRSSL